MIEKMKKGLGRRFNLKKIFYLMPLIILLSPLLVNALACGDTIYNSIELTSNINCPDGASGLIVGVGGITIDCKGYTIIGPTSSWTNTYGIGMAGRSGLTIKNCTMTNFDIGISIGTNSQNIHLESNTLMTRRYGIATWESSDILVFDNLFVGPTQGGLRVRGSDNVEVTGNTFEGSALYFSAIYFEGCDNTNSIVYNNKFLNYGDRAYIKGPCLSDIKYNTTKTLGTNIVNGAYIGGNYWDDYSGTDRGDGFGDTPYKNFDFLPLLYFSEPQDTVDCISDDECTGGDICVSNVCVVPLCLDLGGYGFPPADATLCSGDDTGLTAMTQITLVDSCGTPKCEYYCNAGYTRDGTVCVCTDTTWTPPENTVCDGESFNQTSNCGTELPAIGTKTCDVGHVCQSGQCILTYIDINLRAYDGSQIVTIAVEPQGTLTSPLRIVKGGEIYGIVLVDPADPSASKIRIQTSSGTWAWRKYP